jgi:glycosyltransferase involved in cell wall biosynthesis
MKQIPKDWATLNVALAHDWLNGMRGGERVLELLCESFPEAPVYTLLHQPEGVSDTINRHRIVSSHLQRIPGFVSRYRYFLPLYPWAISQFRPEPADLLISTSHCVAKGLPRPPGARHLCYCFTPMRYAWSFYDEYFGANPVKKLLLQPVLKRLRSWDHDHSAGVDRFVAISHHVQKRIKDFYGRPADVVYPPVDTERCTPGPGGPGHDGYDLIVSALVPYKKVDLAVETYNRLGHKLVIVGTGTEFERLKAIAQPHITFLGWKSDAEILELYRRCRMLIFPGEEDFGIVPVEAMSCGKPVVAYGKGGAAETVVDHESGVFFEEQTPESLAEGIERAGKIHWDPRHIRQNAERFSVQNFLDGLAHSIHACLNEENVTEPG